MFQPLADRFRPQSFEDYLGQTQIMAQGKSLRSLIEAGQLHSMIFWGPPGVGKTTLARLIAKKANRPFMTFSAVLTGIKEVKSAIESAKNSLLEQNPILFIDEIHRFNKAQQDALLPYVEDGTVILIGATTENPSFEVNNALLSRTRLYVLKSLSHSDLETLVHKALNEPRGLGELQLRIEPEALQSLVNGADGDARRLLNTLEVCANKAKLNQDKKISQKLFEEVVQQEHRQFDKGGDLFYEQISALHKSVRGSSPDGAMYWFGRMIDAGCDPLYIGRRLIRMATEDIGQADPRALSLAVDAFKAYQILGSPEGILALAQVANYLAVAPKSNAVYTAYSKVMHDIKKQPSYPVPMHLRNAPTKLMKSLNYGKGYRYDHDEKNQYAKGQVYLPDELLNNQYYYPTQNGLEKKIAEKLDRLKSDADNKVTQ